MAALVLDVGDDCDDEPDQFDWPAPGLALLLAGHAVLQGDGGDVARPQPGDAAVCRGEQDQHRQC